MVGIVPIIFIYERNKRSRSSGKSIRMSGFKLRAVRADDVGTPQHKSPLALLRGITGYMRISIAL